MTLRTSSLRYPRIAQACRRSPIHGRLTRVLETAEEVPFDDRSRIVFFSDLHRGDNSRADAFAQNEDLFLGALTHYYREGFTYVEVGDGDELYKNRFDDVRRAHERTFDLLHRFDRRNRLHLVFGNHDIQSERHSSKIDKDGIIAHEGLILRHSRTGQRVFVVHGHQVDFMSEQGRVVGRPAVHYIWKPLQLLGLARTMGRPHHQSEANDRIEQKIIQWVRARQRRIEQKIIEWLQVYRQVVVCGHTHLPMCAAYGTPSYFNAGSCIYPGYITGLELQNGEIRQVKWSAYSKTRHNGGLRVKRELLGAPRKLHLFPHGWD